MKILVTGGGGFIGRRLVDVLAGDGHHVSVLSRGPARPLPPRVRLIHADLASEDCPLDALLQGCEVVFHCAGETRNVALMRALHVGGTRRLLDAVMCDARRGGRTVHWVQLSTIGAYGEPSGSPNADRIVTEDTPTRPVNEYQITKTLSDDMVIEASRSGVVTATVVRPSKVIGPGMSDNSLCLLGTLVRKGLFFYIGRPGALATYVHVDDVVEVLRRAATASRAKGQVFNVSNDCLLEDMLVGMASTLGVRPPYLRIPESVARTIARVGRVIGGIPLTQERINVLVRRTRYPYDKLVKRLDFTPRVSIPGAVGDILRSL
ncbi:MAG: NAD-dependent epimerase/dehydratase family protein [Gemmatimonadota bacterium]|nr:NAD-dependent epimerase/dehydratase family protein [Gemmatimonadota bacterium]